MSTALEISAQRRVLAFEQQHGTVALHLACHAALPTALSPELLHLLRVNFFLDPPEALPFTAEADLLLSPLCREIDEGLYDIEPTLRNELLRRLFERYGDKRVQRIATLLWRYLEQYAPWADRANLERAQQLTALSFLQPEAAQAWLDKYDRRDTPDGATDSMQQAWYVAMRGELEMAAKAKEAVDNPSIAIESEPVPQKLRVFLSGNMATLKEERKEIYAQFEDSPDIEIVGIETLASRQALLQEIEHSNVYIGLLGSNYGHGGTETEYKRARALNKPCLIYFREDKRSRDKGPKGSMVVPAVHIQSRSDPLTKFKNELRRNYIVKTFTRPQELAQMVLQDINSLKWNSFRAEPPQDVYDEQTELRQVILNFFNQIDQHFLAHMVNNLNLDDLNKVALVLKKIREGLVDYKLIVAVSKLREELTRILTLVNTGQFDSVLALEFISYAFIELQHRLFDLGQDAGKLQFMIPFVPFLLTSMNETIYLDGLHSSWDNLLSICSVNRPSEEILNPRQQFKNLALGYESLCDTMPAGDDRTPLLDDIVSRMDALIRQSDSLVIEEFADSSLAGERLVAVIMLRVHPNSHWISWLNRQFKAGTPFIRYQIALALLEAASSLTISDLHLVRDAIREGQPDVAEETATNAALQQAEQALAQRLDVEKSHSPEGQSSTVGAQLRELALEYDTLRANMAGGDERTSLMWELVLKIKSLIGQAELSLLPDFMHSFSPGERLVAVIMLQLQPGLGLLDWIVQRFVEEKPFIEYQAGIALREAARQLGVSDLHLVSDAIEMAHTYVTEEQDINGHRRLLEEAKIIVEQRENNYQSLIAEDNDEVAPRSSYDAYATYHRYDRSQAHILIELLTQQGLKIWMDEYESAPGETLLSSMSVNSRPVRTVMVLLGAPGMKYWEQPDSWEFTQQASSQEIEVIIVLLPQSPALPEHIGFQADHQIDLRIGFSEESTKKLIHLMDRN